GLLYRPYGRGQAGVAATFVAAYDRYAKTEGFMRVAVAGLGAIGRTLARRLADGVPGLTLSAVAARDHQKARGWPGAQGVDVPVVALAERPEHADLAVECAPAAVLQDICRPMLSAGKQVMVLSCGALLPRPEILELAKQTGGRIVVPTG